MAEDNIVEKIEENENPNMKFEKEAESAEEQKIMDLQNAISQLKADNDEKEVLSETGDKGRQFATQNTAARWQYHWSCSQQLWQC